MTAGVMMAKEASVTMCLSPALPEYSQRASNAEKLPFDDVIKWKHLPRYWLFVRGIHRLLEVSPSQRPVRRTFVVFFDLCLKKRLSKQSIRRWCETSSRSSWRYCNANINYHDLDIFTLENANVHVCVPFILFPSRHEKIKEANKTLTE